MASSAVLKKIPIERADVALNASYQIETMIIALQKLGIEMEDFAEEQVVKLIMNRIKKLNSVIMSVLDKDEGRKTEEMLQVVNLDT